MSAEAQNPQESVFARGKLFELVHVTQPDGRVFEVARRAPGVRLIIADTSQSKLLLTKEYRQELGAWDYRLPGGKVFDTLDAYEAFRRSGEDILVAAKQKGFDESIEETGLVLDDLSLVGKSTLGATVEWDLYVFEASAWHEAEGGQQLEAGENIVADNWFGYDEAEAMIMNGEVQEERIALMLLRWIANQANPTNSIRETKV